ncbi:alanyl-tRNA editing protein [Oceanirhabdus seepicola]|uniref:Alanyl-tRNA editing protein AlaX-L n=1 Tax=Oceanirhabdus seepicola TaxID=2828781 RepID=A0A9J6P3Z6_9CLOT|nr:DHHA1 domain-containing protein [Oceanirhabdus seepicola]MCM1991259.1 alanyl-tRNA editing protein AlaX-L [Oceanirhabdus seepicola]
MQKSYYDNPYKKEFTAEIINVLEKDNKFHVELDETYFYPQGEEHPGDTGSISGTPVLSVYEADEKVYHVVEVKPMKIHKVKCNIDWSKKFDYMQKHLAQYIISAYLFELFNANTVKVNLGDEHSYIDVDRIIESTEIKKVEEMANNLIFDNIKVDTLYPTKAELKKLKLKNIDKKAGGKIRIVKVGDVFAIPCTGILPNSTIELQTLKVIKYENQGIGTRIHFLCGSKAVSNYIEKFDSMEKISKLLSCTDSNVLLEVEKLKKELKKALSERNSLKSEIADYEVQNMVNSCEKIKDISVIKLVHDTIDIKHVNLLASKLTSFPNVIVLFGVKSEDKAQLIFSCTKGLKIISMNILLKDAITLIDGNGGGSDFSAQGGGKNNNNLDSTLDYAYNKIKGIIMGNS